MPKGNTRYDRGLNLDKYIQDSLIDTQSVIKLISNDDIIRSVILKIVKECVEALNNGHKILLAGNGGSAADSQHIAGELVSKFEFDRPGLSAMALTTDTSILTAVGNDYGYENLFSRQIEALGQTGDVFIAYSTSGSSPNIVKALKTAKIKKITTIGFTGARRGKMNEFSDYLIEIPSAHTPRIQEAHLVLGHIICGLIEREIFSEFK
jgi:D-sedoheptulose 7-phosphate isomerase